MKILVTGGMGHIGSKLIRTLSASTIIVVDNFMTQRYSSLFHLPESKNISFYDMNVKEITADWLREVGPLDVIIHLSATTDATANANNRDELFNNNLESTKHIAGLAKDLGIKLIFPSSTSVYGSQSELVDENCLELLPQSPYAESKLAEELHLGDLSKQGLEVAILRLGTIHGASVGMRFHTAVNKFIYQVKLGLSVTVWRTALNQKRPYLSLGDCVLAIDHVIRNSLFSGEIYNVVSNNWTVQEIIDTIQEVSKMEANIVFVDSAIMNQLSYEVSSEKFQKTGFDFKGKLSNDIQESFDLLSGINNA